MFGDCIITLERHAYTCILKCISLNKPFRSDSDTPTIIASCGALLIALAVVYTNRLYCGDNAARFFGRKVLAAFSGPYNIIVLP